MPKKAKTLIQKYNQTNRILRDYCKIVASDGTKINLMCMRHFLDKKIEHLSDGEIKNIKIKYNRFSSLKPYFGGLKLKMKKEHIDINEHILEVKKAEILEMFGAYYTFEEIHKKLIQDTGVEIELATVRKFHSKYRIEIEKIQSDYDRQVGTIGITKKRSRLEHLDYMIRRFRQEFDSATGKSLIPYGNSIKSLLEQARKEVEGDKLQLNIDGTLNISATIDSIKSVEDLYADLNFNQLIVAMMAKQQSVNPLLLHYQMLNSYYSKYTGFNQNTFDMNDEVVHPSKIITGWDEVKDKVNKKKQENQSLQEKFDNYIEDYFLEEDDNIKSKLKSGIEETKREIRHSKENSHMPKKDLKKIIEGIRKKNEKSKKE